MAKEISRRDFLKTSAKTAAGAVALGAFGPMLSAKAEGETAPENTFEGITRFSGVHNVRKITDDLVYLGVNDRRTELFENVYPIPRGVSYNSYLLLDEKTVLFDTVERSASGQFIENLACALDGRKLDYLIINHMEPDHSSAISEIIFRYPEVQLLYTAAAGKIITQFFHFDPAAHGRTVTEGDELVTGRHKLIFTLAPMVHWPEVMMTYDATDKILFSADGFGSFGALDGNLFADEVDFDRDWLPDARRYYCNIVGKYGMQVQAVLKKAAGLDIQTICPLHGPIWRQDLGYILDKYDKWSSYTPEDPDDVVVIYGSVYGGTESAAAIVGTRLSMAGIRNVKTYDVSKTHGSELIAEAFRCGHLVLASITYNMGIFTPMKNLLNDFAAHNLQGRTYSLIENGSWSPDAARQMEAILTSMPGMKRVGETVTIRSTTDAKSLDSLYALADAIAAEITGAFAPLEDETAVEPTKWVCSVCGFVYEGETLPEDYKCPVCGVGAEFFKQK